jgi:hypothetical protein
MRKLMSLVLLGASLAAPVRSNAWVAVARGGYGGACWHGGWSCGGVSTGTAVAAGVAGLAVGAAIGSAAAQANAAAYQSVYVAQPAPVFVPPVQAVPLGTVYYTLPYGAQATTIGGQQYYYLGSTYYRPYFGNNGVYYQVVPFPI